MLNEPLPYRHPTSVLLRPVLGGFLGGWSQPTVVAIQPNGLACRNCMGDYVGLAVYCWLRLS
jgi:hypothetical protein